MKHILLRVVLLNFVNSIIASAIEEVGGSGSDHNITRTNHGNLIWSRVKDGSLVCGDSINGAIFCDDDFLKIARCYCVYYDVKRNTSLFGTCWATCFNPQFAAYFKVKRYHVQNASDFNINMCMENSSTFDYKTNRTGRFCGKCIDGHGLAVYSYQTMMCIPCEQYLWVNWVKYFAISLVPLTLFYIAVVLLKVNFNSGYLSGLVTSIQIIVSPLNLRLIEAWYFSNSIDKITIGLKIPTALYGPLNVDFFRDIYHPFCLNPNYNVMGVIALDYIAAIYPFALILLTYLLIQMHDKNVMLVVWLWKPFKYLLNKFHKRYSNNTSLMETFANFILLSSVKIASVSIFLLVPTNSYDVNGNYYAGYLIIDSTIEWFGREHLPYGILAIFTGFIFVLFPMLLLLLYPCRCFQKFLNSVGLNCHVLRVLMDAFQGNYSLQPYDMRYFSAYYLFLRVLIITIGCTLGSVYALCAITTCLSVNAIVVSAIQPYRNPSHNKLNNLAMSLLALYYIATLSMLTTFYLDVRFILLPTIGFEACQFFLSSYLIILVISYLCGSKLKTLCHKLKLYKLLGRNNLKNGISENEEGGIIRSYSERSQLNEYQSYQSY